MSSKRAFTLIELLVVIAIIATLAAILFPVFAQAKMAAKKAVSTSNIRQLGLAWLMYIGDYDDEIMRDSVPDGVKTDYWWGSWDGTTLRTSEGLLYPYTHSAGIQADPAFPDTLRTTIGLTGYGYNYVYLSPTNYIPPDYTPVPVPVNMSQIGHPADNIAFASCARINNWDYSTPTLEGNAYLEPPSSAYPTYHARYNGVGVVLWCDGHVNSEKPKYRSGTFGYGYNSADFVRNDLADLTRTDNFVTDDLFDLR